MLCLAFRQENASPLRSSFQNEFHFLKMITFASSLRPFALCLLVAVLLLPGTLLAQNKACGSPYASQDLQVLQSIIAENKLNVATPLALGQQVWENGRLTWLSIGSGSAQLYTLPANFGQLDALTHLDLSGNLLRSLPASMGNLRQLQALYLNHNQLEALPPSLGNLVSLERLYLNHNRLTAVPATLGQLQQLRNLYLNNNQIRILPDEVMTLPAIRNLYF